MVIRSPVLDRKYICEWDVGLWTFGTVQVLRERATNVLRTCKVVPKSLIRNPGNVFDRLVKLRELRHEMLSSVVDVLEDAMYYFIISDRCPGQDMAEWIEGLLEEDSWVQEQTIAEYIRQALVGLAHSHSHKVYHRDLRPNNVALTSQDPDASIKVSDCGLLAILDPNAESIQRCATPYTAPELLSAAGGRSASGAADLWSIGAIAHLLLKGEAPNPEDYCTSEGKRLARRPIADSWSERSSLSRDFVQHLLVPAGDRPTAARALQHPWLKAVVGLDASSREPGDEVARDIQRKLLCYMLGVLLVPVVVPQVDFQKFRAIFSQMDGDRDGLIARHVAQKHFEDHGFARDWVEAALRVADVRGAGVLDFCSMLVAGAMLRECLARWRHNGARSEQGKQPEAIKSATPTVKEMAPRMLRRFFQVFGDDPLKLVATTCGIEGRLDTATKADMEAHAGVSYEDILFFLPDDGTIDSQMLVAQLTDHGGRGTPLSQETCSAHRGLLEFRFGDLFGIATFAEAFVSVLQTCGANDEPHRKNCKGVEPSGCVS